MGNETYLDVRRIDEGCSETQQEPAPAKAGGLFTMPSRDERKDDAYEDIESNIFRDDIIYLYFY